MGKSLVSARFALARDFLNSSPDAMMILVLRRNVLGRVGTRPSCTGTSWCHVESVPGRYGIGPSWYQAEVESGRVGTRPS